MAIESKNLLVWVKAMSRGQALPLDASEVYASLAEAENYASTSAIAYPGQTVKALLEDGKYHNYTLQPSDAGYVLEEVGAIDESDLKQYVQVVSTLPTSGQIEGVLYILKTTVDNVDSYTDGYIWVSNAWKHVFWDVSADVAAVESDLSDLSDVVDTKAPIANPVFTGTVKVGEDEVAVKSYVDGLISNLRSETPAVLTLEEYNALIDSGEHPTPGTTYRVAEAATYFGHNCEVGDLIIVVGTVETLAPAADGDTFNPDNFMVIQANITGAVTSSASAATVGEIVVFDAVTGKIIKGSGVQIASLNDAIAKAHEHSNKTVLDSYNKTQAELLAAAESTASGLIDTLTNDIVKPALAEKADKATTLAGYGITDAYTKTEMDGKLDTITQNLNTKVTAAEVDTKISDATPGILESAAEAAAEALEERVGDIPADTDIKSYIDTAVGAGGTASATAIATAKQEAIDTAKSYTDSQISAQKTYIDNQDAATLASAKTYFDEQLTAHTASQKTYIDNQDTATLTSAKSYTDTQLSAALAVVEF